MDWNGMDWNEMDWCRSDDIFDVQGDSSKINEDVESLIDTTLVNLFVVSSIKGRLCLQVMSI